MEDIHGDHSSSNSDATMTSSMMTASLVSPSMSSLPFPVLLPSTNSDHTSSHNHHHHGHSHGDGDHDNEIASPYLSFGSDHIGGSGGHADSLNMSSSSFTSYAPIVKPLINGSINTTISSSHHGTTIGSSSVASSLSSSGGSSSGMNDNNGGTGGMVNRTSRTPIVADHGHSHGNGHDHSHSHASVIGSSSRASDRMAGFGGGVAPLPRGESFANRLRNGSFIRYVQSTAWRERDSRLLFIFIAMKFGIMLIQFTYGVATSATGVISSSFHTGFDCLALFTALGAMVMARKPAKFPFAYGYDRFEVLAGFTNSIFLFFVATFLIIESFHRVYKQPDVHTDDLALAAIGLTVDIVGIAFFHEHTTLRQTSELVAQHQNSIRPDRGHASNVHGVLLHIMADALTHTGLIIATWLVRWKEWYLSHAVVWFVVSIVILRAVYPLFRQTGLILLQTTSSSIQSGLDRCVREISFYDGVLECRSAHWWTQSPGVTIGTLHVRVRAEADEQATLLFANNLLKKYVTHITIQIEKEQLVDWMPALI